MTKIKVNRGGHFHDADVANTDIHRIEYSPVPWNSHLNRHDMEMQRVLVSLDEEGPYYWNATY